MGITDLAVNSWNGWANPALAESLRSIRCYQASLRKTVLLVYTLRHQKQIRKGNARAVTMLQHHRAWNTCPIHCYCWQMKEVWCFCIVSIGPSTVIQRVTARSITAVIVSTLRRSPVGWLRADTFIFMSSDQVALSFLPTNNKEWRSHTLSRQEDMGDHRKLGCIRRHLHELPHHLLWKTNT